VKPWRFSDGPDKLETAASELQSSGIDRANLSLLAHAVERSLNQPLTEDPSTPREAAGTDPDLR
jgi:hypothetical protein